MTKLLLNYEKDNDLSDQYKKDNDLSDLYKKDIIEINETQKNILDYINTQDEKIDSIENNLTSADFNTYLGKDNLIMSNNYNISYKGVLLGGLIGSMFISPFGYLLGLKAGTIISLSGIVIGSVSSYKLQIL